MIESSIIALMGDVVGIHVYVLTSVITGCFISSISVSTLYGIYYLLIIYNVDFIMDGSVVVIMN